MRRYDYFKYTLPTETAEFYAQRAVKILQGIRAEFPHFYLDLFRAPSEVLTLSGVRAIDVYYSFGKEADDTEIEALRKYLRQHGIWLLDDKMPLVDVGNPEKHYLLVNEQALRKLPKQYRYIPEWHDLNTELMQRDADFVYWWLFWKDLLGSALVTDELKLPKEWRADYWVLHNITFGMLLGYPGEAICSALYSDADAVSGKEVLREGGLNEKEYAKAVASGATIEVTSNVLHAQKFHHAVPEYTYHAAVRKNKNIVAHQKLWSDILDEVYHQMGEI